MKIMDSNSKYLSQMVKVVLDTKINAGYDIRNCQFYNNGTDYSEINIKMERSEQDIPQDEDPLDRFDDFPYKNDPLREDDSSDTNNSFAITPKEKHELGRYLFGLQQEKRKLEQDKNGLMVSLRTIKSKISLLDGYDNDQNDYEKTIREIDNLLDENNIL
jgi:hypothetical protein